MPCANSWRTRRSCFAKLGQQRRTVNLCVKQPPPMGFLYSGCSSPRAAARRTERWRLLKMVLQNEIFSKNLPNKKVCFGFLSIMNNSKQWPPAIVPRRQRGIQSQAFRDLRPFWIDQITEPLPVTSRQQPRQQNPCSLYNANNIAWWHL